MVFVRAVPMGCRGSRQSRECLFPGPRLRIPSRYPTPTCLLAIRPFQVDTPEEKLAELRRRIAATRRPAKELVADRSQGVQLATIQAPARYWATDFDWRKADVKLDAFPEFTTKIDG